MIGYRYSKGMGVGMGTRLIGKCVCYLLVLLCGVAHANTVTYVYTDPQGTPLAEADANGNITATFDYAPYGSQVLGTPPNGPGYAGHVNDPDTGLVYMQARYYDPATGRFLSVDPFAPAAANVFNFGRYVYANNNPIKNTDPDGRESASLTMMGISSIESDLNQISPATAKLGVSIETSILLGPVAGETLGMVRTAVAMKDNVSPDTPAPAPAPTQNTNPYQGPVSSPVVVVDKDGNAIPVQAGDQVTSSPNGDYQQVRDSNGTPTGDRLDRAGHRNQSDQKAQVPHAHRQGVSDSSGNPHLPINSPTPSPPPPPPTQPATS